MLPTQKDIVVATTNEIPGNNNAAVPLTFKHICTAVRFAVGSQMQPGSIKSVVLKGVKNAGTYDMATGNWSLGDATVDFSQTLNKETTGTEANGDAITSPGRYLHDAAADIACRGNGRSCICQCQ